MSCADVTIIMCREFEIGAEKVNIVCIIVYSKNNFDFNLYLVKLYFNDLPCSEHSDMAIIYNKLSSCITNV